MIDRVVYVPHGDRWATNSRDGTIKLWSGKDLRHLRTLRCGSAWVTDMGVMPRQNKLVAATFRCVRVCVCQRESLSVCVTSKNYPPP
jgi:WD40 repeat protein